MQPELVAKCFSLNVAPDFYHYFNYNDESFIHIKSPITTSLWCYWIFAFQKVQWKSINNHFKLISTDLINSLCKDESLNVCTQIALVQSHEMHLNPHNLCTIYQGERMWTVCTVSFLWYFLYNLWNYYLSSIKGNY